MNLFAIGDKASYDGKVKGYLWQYATNLLAWPFGGGDHLGGLPGPRTGLHFRCFCYPKA